MLLSDLFAKIIEWDVDLFVAINRLAMVLRKSELETVFRFTDQLGNGATVLVLVPAILVLCRWPRPALLRLLQIGLTFGALGLVNHLLKWTVDRPRPQGVFRAEFLVGDMTAPFGEYFTGGSFPSGHTSYAFALATMLTFWAWMALDRPRRWIVAIWAFFLASLTGFCRVYSGMHFPLDTVAGAFTGVIVTLVILKITERLSVPGWVLRWEERGASSHGGTTTPPGPSAADRTKLDP